MFSPRIQIGEVKPPGPVWRKFPVEKVGRDGNRQKQEDQQHSSKDRDQDEDKDGHSIDEYA